MRAPSGDHTAECDARSMRSLAKCVRLPEWISANHRSTVSEVREITSHVRALASGENRGEAAGADSPRLLNCFPFRSNNMREWDIRPFPCRYINSPFPDTENNPLLN